MKTPNGYVSPRRWRPWPRLCRASRCEQRFEQLVRDTVISAEAAGNMVVVKTPVAAAQPLASAIDAMPIDDALGTIGGDDTIFVAFRTPAAAAPSRGASTTSPASRASVRDARTRA